MSGFGNVMKKIAPVLGMGVGAVLGGPAGAAVGGSLGSGISSLFGGGAGNSGGSSDGQPTNAYGETEEQRRARLMNNQTRMV